jgi:hypothetical protein
MLDHVGIIVPKDKQTEVVDFYLAALKPLGYEKLASFANDMVVGLGTSMPADWWVCCTTDNITGPIHVAFRVEGLCSILSLVTKKTTVGVAVTAANALN